jgi:hypothetical protein
MDGVPVPVPVLLCVGDPVPDSVGEAVMVGDGVSVWLPVCDAVTVGDAVMDGVPVWLMEAV